MRKAGPLEDVSARYFGLDVHKATIGVDVADFGSPPVLFGRSVGGNPEVFAAQSETPGSSAPKCAGIPAV